MPSFNWIKDHNKSNWFFHITILQRLRQELYHLSLKWSSKACWVWKYRVPPLSIGRLEANKTDSPSYWMSQCKCHKPVTKHCQGGAVIISMSQVKTPSFGSGEGLCSQEHSLLSQRTPVWFAAPTVVLSQLPVTPVPASFDLLGYCM